MLTGMGIQGQSQLRLYKMLWRKARAKFGEEKRVDLRGYFEGNFCFQECNGKNKLYFVKGYFES